MHYKTKCALNMQGTCSTHANMQETCSRCASYMQTSHKYATIMQPNRHATTEWKAINFSNTLQSHLPRKLVLHVDTDCFIQHLLSKELHRILHEVLYELYIFTLSSLLIGKGVGTNHLSNLTSQPTHFYITLKYPQGDYRPLDSYHHAIISASSTFPTSIWNLS